MPNDSDLDERPRDRDLQSQVDEFLLAKDSDPEFIRECFWRIVDQLREMTSFQRRAALYGLAVFLVFELLNRRLVSETALGGFKLAKLDFLRVLAPVIAGYLFLRLMAIGRDRAVYVQIVYRFSRSKFKGLYRSELDRIFTYSSGPLVSRIPSSFVVPWRSWTVDLAAVLEGLFFHAVPPAFCLYAFVQLVRTEGVGSLPVWLSLIASIFLLLLGGLISTASPSVYDKDWLRDMPFRSSLSGWKK
ncbi:hypothetical protein [Micromonospora inyonensis]|uniref:hypothetical protein n=1 Tax=Micromonospora inyonensis TaxID=47866 RepID=UPI00114CCE97|nr:hypothetical protein [Micromonospora inyonensis]